MAICKVSEMQASAHFIAQAFFCENRDKRKIDDNAYRQYNGRPGKEVWTPCYATD